MLGLQAALTIPLLLAAPRQDPQPPQRIDFTKVSREIGDLPTLGNRPKYGLFLFGLHGRTRVWAVLDPIENGDATCWRLHLDLDADGDLTGRGETLLGVDDGARPRFVIERFEDPATGAVHRDWKLAFDEAGKVRDVRLSWRGGKRQMILGWVDGSCRFAKARADAPVFVPGWDRPLAFTRGGERGADGVVRYPDLRRGEANDFKTFVGSPGSERGAFFCVREYFLEPECHLIADLHYESAAGVAKVERFHLRERC